MPPRDRVLRAGSTGHAAWGELLTSCCLSFLRCNMGLLSGLKELKDMRHFHRMSLRKGLSPDNGVWGQRLDP